jgi:hypothetical protein
MPNEAGPRFLPNEKISRVDVAFPARVAHLMPPLPLASYKRRAECERFAMRWFYDGLNGATFVPRAGINQSTALRHIRCILGSYEPSHEHKIEAVAWLLDQWFEEVVRGEEVLLRRETP